MERIDKKSNGKGDLLNNKLKKRGFRFISLVFELEIEGKTRKWKWCFPNNKEVENCGDSDFWND